MADADEPDELDQQIRRARKRMDAGRADLMALIADAFKAGRTNARIARNTGWSETRIKQIRAQSGDSKPR